MARPARGEDVPARLRELLGVSPLPGLVPASWLTKAELRWALQYTTVRWIEDQRWIPLDELLTPH